MDDEVELDTLRENYDVLIDNLPDADVPRMVGGLFARHCLTEYEKADILEGARNGFERRQRLVDCLLRRGLGAFNALCDLLESQAVTRGLSSALREGKHPGLRPQAQRAGPWPRSATSSCTSFHVILCVCLCTCNTCSRRSACWQCEARERRLECWEWRRTPAGARAQ